MRNIKKIGLCLMLLFIIFSFNFSFGRGLRDYHPISREYSGASTPKVDEIIVDSGHSISQGSDIFSQKLNGIIHVPQSNEYNTSLGYALSLIKFAINRLLGMLAFVALVYMLYNGFLIFTAGSDDKNSSKGKKGISTAAIALAGIGLSWLIISVIIWLINNIAAS